MLTNAERPKVSVRIITFNHAQYIAQSLDSVLAQETDFVYEIVVGDDCSTDGTRRVLQEYRDRHPDKIRLILYEKNTGAQHNARCAYRACRGRYVAFLDGDDFWTDAHKLQRQVDFLDRNPGCPLCLHNVEVRYEDGRPTRLYHPAGLKPFLNTEDLLHTCLIPNSSKMLRKDWVGEFPRWFGEFLFSDWPSDIYCSLKGDVGYIDGVMGVYRIHPAGVWSSKSSDPYDKYIRHCREDVKFFRRINRYLGRKYEKIIEYEIQARQKRILACCCSKAKRRLIGYFPHFYEVYRRVKYGFSLRAVSGGQV